MSKAVLIMDMPECCYICPMTQCEADNMSTEHRGENCPLRELPERESGVMVGAYTIGRADGWNACLDAIGGNKENE